MQKGITPVVAIILLVLITVSMVGFAFVWFSRTTQSTGFQIENQTSNAVTQMGAKLKVEGFFGNEVYIRNAGTTALSNIGFYINGVMISSNNPVIQPGTVGTAVLDPGQLAAFSGDVELTVTGPGGMSDVEIITLDTTPPIISNVQSSGITPSAATITWTTDKAANGRVEYGTTTAYGYSSALYPSFVTSHSIPLSGLSALTLYHYRVNSSDAANNNATSADYTFTTLAVPDTTPPTVSITSPLNGATVSGNIPVTATASDNVAVAGVQFKLDSSNLGAEDTTSPYSISWNTRTASNGTHALTATARDTSGNTATSAPITVTVSNVPWYNSAWEYRKPLTISASQVVGSHANFPVLVRLASDAELVGSAQADSDDILFTAGDGTTKLDHEIEMFNGTTGQLVAWVRLPALAGASDTRLYMYYGNAAASSQQNPKAVWSSDYRGVWHLDETVSNNKNVKDSTANSNNGTFRDTNGNSATGIAGVTGHAINFYGDADNINTSDSTTLDIYNRSFTAQAWVYPTPGASGYRTVFNVIKTMGTQTSYYLREYSTSPGGLSVGYYSDDLSTSNAVFSGVWTFIVATYDNVTDTTTLYINGTYKNSGSNGPFIAAAPKVYIGSHSTAQYYNGTIDEVRLATVLHSAEWIQTEYNNQKPGSTFMTVGAQEAYS